MKTLFFVMAVSTLFMAPQSHAESEEILTCEDSSQDPNTWIYSLEKDSDENFFYRLKKKEGGTSRTYSAKFVQETQKDRCIFKIVHEKGLTGEPVKLDYRKEKGKDRVFITMRDQYPIFQDVGCKFVSKELKEKMRTCTDKATQAEETPELEQGLRCTSSPVDTREMHILIKTDKKVDFAKGAIFSVASKGKTTSLETAEISMVSRLDKDGACTLNIDEKSEKKKNKLSMQVTIDKEDRSKAKAYIKDTSLEALEGHRNMQCEVSGNLFEKLQKCEVGTAEAKKDLKVKEVEPTTKTGVAI